VNAKLRQLLATAGVRDHVIKWSDVLVAHSLGAVPPPTNAEADAIRYRGFYLVLLDARGTPTHFCKCRPVTDNELAHETALLETLCHDPRLRTVVPETRGVRTTEMLMQISAYLPGPAYLREVGRQSDAVWAQSMREILTAAHLLAECATALVPSLAGDPAPLNLEQLGSGPLTDLGTVGFTAPRAEALQLAMRRAGPLGRRLQHGDLFPGNIIRWAGSWWLVDLARYGWCQVPMFDAYHFVRSCCALRQDGRGARTVEGWYQQLTGDGRVAATAQRTLAWVAGQAGLTAAQCIGALAYYSVDITARLIQRRAPPPTLAPFLADTERLADALRAGESVERVFFGIR